MTARRIGIEIAADEPELFTQRSRARQRHRLATACRLRQLADANELLLAQRADPMNQVVAQLRPGRWRRITAWCPIADARGEKSVDRSRARKPGNASCVCTLSRIRSSLMSIVAFAAAAASATLDRAISGMPGAPGARRVCPWQSESPIPSPPPRRADAARPADVRTSVLSAPCDLHHISRHVGSARTTKLGFERRHIDRLFMRESPSLHAFPDTLTGTKADDRRRCTPRIKPTLATGIVPVADSVDARTTMAEPATPAPPFDVASRIASSPSCWPSDS